MVKIKTVHYEKNLNKSKTPYEFMRCFTFVILKEATSQQLVPVVQ